MAFGGGLDNLNKGQLAALWETLGGGLEVALRAEANEPNEGSEEKQIKESIEKKQLVKQELTRLLERPNPELKAKLTTLGIELNKESISQLVEGFVASNRSSSAADGAQGKPSQLGKQLVADIVRQQSFAPEAGPKQRDQYVRLGVGLPDAKGDFPELQAEGLEQAQRQARASKQAPIAPLYPTGMPSAVGKEKQKVFTLPDGQVVTLNAQGQVVAPVAPGKLMGGAKEAALEQVQAQVNTSVGQDLPHNRLPSSAVSLSRGSVDAAILAQMKPGMLFRLPDGRQVTMSQTGEIVPVPLDGDGFEQPAAKSPGKTNDGNNRSLSGNSQRQVSERGQMPSLAQTPSSQSSLRAALLPGGSGQFVQLSMTPAGGFEAVLTQTGVVGAADRLANSPEARFSGQRTPWQVDGKSYQQLLRQGMRPEQALATLQAQGMAVPLTLSSGRQAGALQQLRDGEFIFFAEVNSNNLQGLDKNDRRYRVAIAERFAAAMGAEPDLHASSVKLGNESVAKSTLTSTLAPTPGASRQGTNKAANTELAATPSSLPASLRAALSAGASGQFVQLSMSPAGGFEAVLPQSGLPGAAGRLADGPEARFTGQRTPWQVESKSYQQLLRQGMQPEQALATLQAQGLAVPLALSSGRQVGALQQLRDGEFVFFAEANSSNLQGLDKNDRRYRVAIAERFAAAMGIESDLPASSAKLGQESVAKSTLASTLPPTPGSSRQGTNKAANTELAATPSSLPAASLRSSLLPGASGQLVQLSMSAAGGFEAVLPHMATAGTMGRLADSPESRFSGLNTPWQIDSPRYQQLLQQGMRPEQALATLQTEGLAVPLNLSAASQLGTLQQLRDGEFIFVAVREGANGQVLDRNDRRYRVAVAERFATAMGSNAQLQPSLGKLGNESLGKSTSGAQQGHGADGRMELGTHEQLAQSPLSTRPSTLGSAKTDNVKGSLLAAEQAPNFLQQLLQAGGTRQLAEGMRQLLQQGGGLARNPKDILSAGGGAKSETKMTSSVEALLEQAAEPVFDEGTRNSRLALPNKSTVFQRQQALLNARRSIIGAGNVFGGFNGVQDSKITSATIEALEQHQGDMVDFAVLTERFPNSPSLKLQRMFRFADVSMQSAQPPTMLDVIDDMLYGLGQGQLEGAALPGVHALLSSSRDDVMSTVRDMLSTLMALPHPRDASGREIPLSVAEMEAQLVAFAQQDLPTLARLIRQSSSSQRQVLLGIWSGLPDFLASLHGKPNQELQDRIGHLGRFCLELRMAQLSEQPGVALQTAFQVKSLQESLGQIWSNMEPPLATFLDYKLEQELPNRGMFPGYDKLVVSQMDMQKVGVGLSNGLVMLVASGGLTWRDKSHANRYLEQVRSKLYDDGSLGAGFGGSRRLRNYAGPNDAKVGFERIEAVPLIIL